MTAPPTHPDPQQPPPVRPDPLEPTEPGPDIPDPAAPAMEEDDDKAARDVVSDPALDDQQGHDWSSEGGAAAP